MVAVFALVMFLVLRLPAFTSIPQPPYLPSPVVEVQGPDFGRGGLCLSRASPLQEQPEPVQQLAYYFPAQNMRVTRAFQDVLVVLLHNPGSSVDPFDWIHRLGSEFFPNVVIFSSVAMGQALVPEIWKDKTRTHKIWSQAILQFAHLPYAGFLMVDDEMWPDAPSLIQSIDPTFFGVNLGVRPARLDTRDTLAAASIQDDMTYPEDWGHTQQERCGSLGRIEFAHGAMVYIPRQHALLSAKYFDLTANRGMTRDAALGTLVKCVSPDKGRFRVDFFEVSGKEMEKQEESLMRWETSFCFPTASPTTPEPSRSPTTLSPSRSPSAHPSGTPSRTPSFRPTHTPSAHPSKTPSRTPTGTPSVAPT